MKLRVWLFVVLFALAVVSAGAHVAGPLANKAFLYAGWFMSGGYEYVSREFTPEMKAAMTPSRLNSIIRSMEAQNGSFDYAGDPWLEDHVQTYTRYRVPLHFDNETVDMRIVFDTDGRVAGTFFVAHTPPPSDSPKPPVREEGVMVGDST